MRDRLKELILTAPKTDVVYGDIKLPKPIQTASTIADHLIANGVIVPPCKVGDIYYTIERYCNTDPCETEKELVKLWDCERYCGRGDCSFREYRIEEHRFNSVIRILEAQEYFGKTVFLTREDAERALEEMNNAD